MVSMLPKWCVCASASSFTSLHSTPSGSNTKFCRSHVYTAWLLSWLWGDWAFFTNTLAKLHPNSVCPPPFSSPSSPGMSHLALSSTIYSSSPSPVLFEAYLGGTCLGMVRGSFVPSALFQVVGMLPGNYWLLRSPPGYILLPSTSPVNRDCLFTWVAQRVEELKSHVITLYFKNGLAQAPQQP